MRIRDVVTHKGDAVACVRPEESVAVALALMAHRCVGSVVVSADGRRPAGIVSEREVVLAMHQRGAAVVDAAVANVMLVAFATCTPDDAVEEVLATMTATRLRHVPVIARGEMAGIVSIGDLVKARLGELESDNFWMRDYLLRSP